MITNYYLDSEKKYSFYDEGCGCCSNQYYLDNDINQIILELKSNYSFLIECCDILNIKLEDLKT